MPALAYHCSVYRGILIFLSVFLFSGFQKPDELNVGNDAPDFSAVTLGGDSIRLSALKGSLVYLDFWASWCLPCRRQNPGIVKLQDKYRAIARKKGLRLVVISISMDTNRELWRIAVSKDNLSPRTQVCDLKGWESPVAKDYAIKKLPCSFLVGTDGKIIGKNIWNAQLDEALDAQYKQLSN